MILMSIIRLKIQPQTLDLLNIPNFIWQKLTKNTTCMICIQFVCLNGLNFCKLSIVNEFLSDIWYNRHTTTTVMLTRLQTDNF